jgi:predicted murein hydrolase (TIGR00659 family)
VERDLTELWVYLSASPLSALLLTLAAYQVGHWVFEKTGRFPLANPLLISVGIAVTILYLGGIDYWTYFEGAQFVHFMLGPATVALAVPLYRQFRTIRRSAVALLVSIVVGSVTAAGSALAIGWFLGASTDMLAALVPKSVTTPIAMGITEQLGGPPSLTAVIVLFTGVIGAMSGTFLLNLFRIRDWRARGLAMGVSSHGIGTARALEVNEVAGAFSGLAIGLNGLATAILLPILWRLAVG